MTTIITKETAHAIGRLAAELATAEIDFDRDPLRPLNLLSGYVLQNVRSRDELLQAIDDGLAEVMNDPDVFKAEEFSDARESGDTAQIERIEACREWLHEFKTCMQERPEDVHFGITAWVDEYIKDQNLDPATLREID